MGRLTLNRNGIKYLAIVAMLIDHIAWVFVPTESFLGQGMHFVGRLTGPIMAYLLYEGYHYTKDRKKYAMRLGIFALISWIPFSLFEMGRIAPCFGVIYTLFLAFLTLWMWDQATFSKWVKVLLVILFCALSCFGDWPVIDIIIPFYFLLNEGDPKRQWRIFVIILAMLAILCELGAILSGHPIEQLFQFGGLMVPLVLKHLYNGQPGSKSAFHKWFFYVFYPLHLIIIVVLRSFLC